MYYVWLIFFFYVVLMVIFGLIISMTGGLKNNKNTKNNKKKEYIDNSKKVIKRNKWHKITLILYFISFLLVILYHYFSINSILFWTIPFVFIAFIWNGFLTFSSYFNPIYTKSDKQSINDFRVAVVIPVYNEDKEIFKKVLDSLTVQTKLPDYVYIIEDGSLEENRCDSLFDVWKEEFPNRAKYIYKENAGKREAQAVAFNELSGLVDIYVTIDSDTILNEDAIEQGLYPFFDEKIMSVGGALLDYNNRDNFLTRSVGVSFVSAFSNGRSAYSRWKAVNVNHGCLAFYRSKVIDNYIDHYLSQIIFSQKAKFGDDRMLTQYASIMGDTVYQETSIGYTLNPIKFSHLLRQRSRWWRSFWWGGLWFIKYQNPNKMAWWIQLSHFISFGTYVPVFFAVYFYYPIVNREFPIVLLLYTIVLGYFRNIRTLTFERKDMSKVYQFVSYIIFSPFSTIINFLICNILQIYGLVTVWKVSDWGTRKKVEVGIDENN